jgi:maleamate amidohydrolase
MLIVVGMGPHDAVAQDYADHGFGGRLQPGNWPALLLIDFAKAYYDRESPLCIHADAERDAAVALRDAARRAGVPVVFTRVEYVPGDPSRDGGHFFRKIAGLASFVAGNPLGDFTAELSPGDNDRVVTKQYPSAFFGTGLAQHLHALGVDTCVIAGLSTSGCVRATALDALCHGFIPLVVADACGDRDRAVHDANLFDLKAKYAEVTDSAAMIAYFDKVAACPAP